MYQGFLKFLDDALYQLGYSYFIENGNNSYYTHVVLTKVTENLVVPWQIENNLLYSQEIDTKSAGYLKTLFFNKIFFFQKMQKSTKIM